MRRVVSSEWAKLARKGMLAAAIAGVLVTVLGTLISVLSAGTSTADRGHLLSATRLTVAELTSSRGAAEALANASTLLGIIALGVVAASVGGEYSNGTLRNLLVREPNRVRLLLGKLLGLAGAISLVVVLAVALAVVAGLIGADSNGHDVSAWTTGSGIGHLLVAVVQMIAATLGWALIGAILAITFRSTGIAIVVGVVYALPLENIFGDISGVARWLPGKLLTAIAAGGNTTASLGAAIWTIALYATLALTAATWIFRRRDVAT
jgi:ABC-2 type transport system permease protein